MKGIQPKMVLVCPRRAGDLLPYTPMPRFPSIAASTDGLPDRVFSRIASRAGAHTGRIFPLHIGDTWLEPLAAARAEAQRTEDCARLHNYTPVQGEPVLLDAIVAHLAQRAGVAV